MNSNSKNWRAAGFTLLEILVVVTVMAILVGMALPRFFTARKSAHESATIAGLRTINNGNEVYKGRTGSYGGIDDLISQELVDANFASARSGYLYSDGGAVTRYTWSVNAEPETPGESGDRYFFIDESGVIRTTSTPPASAGSSAVD